MAGQRQKSPMVGIRIDRLQAAGMLDERTWPEIAKELDTTHQRLYHLTAGHEPMQRRCRQHLRDAFADLFQVPFDWLSGQTDALPYVPVADATAISLEFANGRDVQARLSAFQGAGRQVPALQLMLDRLLARADEAVRRDLDRSALEEQAGPKFLRASALFLVAACAEVGLDLIDPLPAIADADALRVSAVRHAEQIFQPWFDDRGSYPDWERIYERVKERGGEDTRVMRTLIEQLGYEGLVAMYRQLRGWQ